MRRKPELTPAEAAWERDWMRREVEAALRRVDRPLAQAAVRMANQWLTGRRSASLDYVRRLSARRAARLGIRCGTTALERAFYRHIMSTLLHSLRSCGIGGVVPIAAVDEVFRPRRPPRALGRAIASLRGE